MYVQILTIFYFITIVFAQLNITLINENNTLNYDFNNNDTITTTTEYSVNDTKITTTEIYNNNDENDTSTTISPENTSLSEYYQDIMTTTTTSSNESETILPDRIDRIANRGAICQPGLLLSVWEPQANLTIGDRISRGLLYFIILCYLFLGVSIVSDRFMAGIEIITAKEKEVRIRKADGEIQIVVVRIWNGTVANLTLMALGTSAPEILLSIIEIFSKHFQAGDLGPGTIVGSAAYNLLCITALCVFVIPDGEVRKIKHLRVFFITTTFSIFAYIWLYLILSKISPGRVDVWEGLITFLFFPLLVYVSYVADRRLSVFKYLSKEYRMNKRGIMIKVETDAGIEMSDRNGYKSTNYNGGAIDSGVGGDGDDDATEDMELYYDEYKDLEDARNEYVNALKLLRKQHPDIDLGQLEIMAQEDMINKGPKSRAFYRVQATSKMVGRGNIIKKNAQRNLNELKAELHRVDTIGVHNDDLGIAKISFAPSHYTVMENCGEFEVFVVRQGDFSATVTVEYETEDGSAEAGTDYIYKKGQLIFTPGIVKQKIQLEVIDDDVFEQDEHFYVTLKNVSDNAILSSARMATIMILDDDHGGIFSFAKKDHELIETIGIYEIIVKRSSGARGKVIVPFCTEDATAKAGKDYEEKQGELIFEDNESEKTIPLVILEEGSYEKDVLLYVNLGEPQMVGDELANAVTEAEAKAPEDLTEQDKMALLGRPKAGDITRAQLRIKESKEFKNTVDKLVQRANASLLIGTSSWKEQFSEALTVSAGDDAQNGDDEPSPSCGDYIMHFLTLFWKIIFAFIPPTDIYSGYVCFVVSIICIGIVTAIIGDVASHFGCTLGIKDSVTAIVFVALGTSIPDTFASKVAAIQDKYADASVGNVTGSNAVNVFLGIGVAWTIAAVYHAFNGTTFNVDPGNLAFSVTLFCTEAFIAIAILLARRSKAVGGELGGPRTIKIITSLTLFGLWIIYLIISTLEAYGVIKGF